MRNNNIRKLTTLSILCAIAFLLTFLAYVMPVFIPAAPFLNYEPKDVIIMIAGFLYGPLAVIPMSIVVSMLEMPFSGTSVIGLVMNVISTCTFACTAAVIYKRWRTILGACIGLGCGVIVMTGVMLLWNYLITPLYMFPPEMVAQGREIVKAMLLPAFLPFNFVKGCLNAALTILLYKPISAALIKSNMLPVPEDSEKSPAKVHIGIIIVALFVIATCVLIITLLQ